MAIEHADSFDIYGTDSTLLTDGVYAEIDVGVSGGLKPDPDGLSTQRCLFQNGGVLRYALQTPTDVVGMSRRVWFSDLPSDAGAEPILFYWADIDNVSIAFVKVQTNGAIKFEVVGGLTYSTNVPVITAEAWWHVECRLEVSTTGTGKFELRVEDVPVIEETGLTFNNSTIYQCKTGSEVSVIGAYTSSYMKDLVIWNDLGSDNTDFLGPVRVINLWPESDVTVGGWEAVPSGDGHEILDNNPPLNSQYMLATPDAVDVPMQYGMTDLPDDITSVKGVMTFVRARKIDGGYGQLQISMAGTGAAESAGTDRPITAGYVYWRDVHERDPGTGAAWSRVGVNDSQLKINRTL